MQTYEDYEYSFLGVKAPLELSYVKNNNNNNDNDNGTENFGID